MYSNIDSNKVLLSEFAVRCRTGSLETKSDTTVAKLPVRCRTGSLEKFSSHIPLANTRALPHRQLRNCESGEN